MHYYYQENLMKYLGLDGKFFKGIDVLCKVMVKIF